MLMNFKSNFARLATQLYIENKKDKSKAVCDRCIELMPNDIIPYNYFNAQIAEVYYNLKEYEKANIIIKVLVESSERELTYYFNLDQKKFNTIQEEMERQLALFNELVKMVKRHNLPELQKDIEAKFNKLYKLYSMKSGG
jgi:tetratricopeptide (TPR) repeat protein